MDMIENISNIYLAYFDLSRVSTEQRLYIVWVIEVNGNKYVFNAVTGASVEE